MLVQTLSVLALATGAVVAMPAHAEKRDWQGNNRWWQRPNNGAEVTVTGYAAQPTDWNTDATSTATVVATTTTTVVAVTSASAAGNFYGQGSYQHQSQTAASSPTETAQATSQQTQWGSSPQASATSQQTGWGSSPQATATSAPSTGGSGGQDDYMSVVSQWRAAGGLPALTQDSTLEGNALKTSTDSTNGLEHELNPGSFAQVLAPGDDSDFESVYVGGWLCEVPSLAGLNGICGTEAQGWDHSNGETGHADILSSTKYTKIGCAMSESTKVWACDLA